MLGLENDYASLGGADKDKFELHLRNLMSTAFGNSFGVSKVKVRFPQIAEAEICHIEIQPATEPLVLKLTDKTGQKIERFYARSGNSSQEIPLSEMSAYMKDRFKS